MPLIVAANPPPPMPNVLRSPAHLLLIARLKQARKEAGLTQVQVAARLGVPQSYVAKVEGGERRLDVVDFVRLTQAMGADPAMLLGELAAVLAVDQPLPAILPKLGETTG